MSATLSIPTKKELRKADRSQLIAYYENAHKMRNEWIRRQVIENDRIDILAIEVLGLQVQPFHLALMKFQFDHAENLQLCFRGAGKSTTCTEVKVIHLLLKNPNLRILIASKTLMNAQGFLKNIKAHFETNERLSEIFGSYYDPKRVGKWDDREIEVLPRTIVAKEASVTCVGVEGTVVSKHYDVIISDDLVDEDNSRTKLQRDKTRTWFYNTLMPTLEPPDPKVPHRGEHHMLGTRYHYDDLYGHLIANELAEHHQIIPALDVNGKSPWPEKYPAKWFAERRRRAGLIIFNCHSEDTEFLTENGWKLAEDVLDGEKLATFDGKAGIVFQDFTHRFDQQYEGEMLRVKSRSADALVTPNHRFYARALTGKSDKPESFRFVSAEELHSIRSTRTGRVELPASGILHGRSRLPRQLRKYDLDTFMKFLGFFISEGRVTWPVRGTIQFSQKEGDVCDDMIATLRAMKVKLWVNKNHLPYVHFGFADMELWKWLRENCGHDSGSKRVPRFAQSAPAHARELLLQALIDGDGCRNDKGSDGSFWYTTTSPGLAGDIQELGIGLGCMISMRHEESKNPKWADKIGLYGSFRATHGVLTENIERVAYSGRVVCFSVPNETLVTRRNGRVLISGNCQYQCDTEAMKGEIFQYDQCQQLPEADWPDHKSLRIFMGVDLAISEEEQADKFAIVVIGITKDRSAYYVLDYYENQLRFKAQTAKIVEYYRRWRPIRVALETNQYQDAQRQTLKDDNPDIRLKKVQTDKDKITRAWKLSSIFEDMRVFFRKGVQSLLIEHLVLFPNHKYKDLFDAFDLAVNASKMKKKRGRREKEPGVI